MAEYRFRFDCLDAVLLLAMASEVRSQVDARSFTEANRVHVPSLRVSLAVRCRTTQCRMLGLVAKLDGPGGKQIPGMWVITDRGWAALRGEQVPENVIVFRNEIQERTEEVITLREALELNRAKVESAQARGKKGGTDYRHLLNEYNPATWVDIEKYGQGHLI